MAQDEITLHPRGPTQQSGAPASVPQSSLPVQSQLPQQQQGPSTLQRLLPLIQFASLAALQGPTAAGGFGQSFTRTSLAQERLAQQSARDRAIVSQNAQRMKQQEVTNRRMQRATDAQIAGARQRAEIAREERVQRIITGARTATSEVFSREEHDEALASFMREAELIGINPNIVRRAVPFVSDRASRLSGSDRAKRAKALTDQYDPEQLRELLREGGTVMVNGEQVPIVEILRASPTTAFDSDGNVVVAGQSGATTSDDIFPKSEFGFALRSYVNDTGKSPSELTSEDFDAIQALAVDPLSNTSRESLTRLLRQDAQRETASTRELNSLIARMRIAMDEARKGNRAAADEVMLTTFARINDPASVVRESEFWRLASGLSLLSRAEGIKSRLETGGQSIPLDELENFARVAERIGASQRSSVGDILSRIRRQATRSQLVVDEIVPSGISLDVPSDTETNVDGGLPDPTVQRMEFVNGVLTRVP